MQGVLVGGRAGKGKPALGGGGGGQGLWEVELPTHQSVAEDTDLVGQGTL